MKYTFTILNEKTKDAQKKIERYNESNKYDIYDAYTQPSSTKVSSFYKLLNKMKELDGYDMKITGAGSDNYSCAYKIKENEAVYLIYETRLNSFKIKYN